MPQQKGVLRIMALMAFNSVFVIHMCELQNFVYICD